MQHSFRAMGVAKDAGWDLDSYATDNGWSGVGVGPVGQHRDSGVLDRCNFQVVYADLSERFPDRVSDPRFGHWAVGWVEEIAYDFGNRELHDAVEEWRTQLESYPVASDEKFSEMEYEESVSAIPDLATSETTVDGVDYELSDRLPDDWAYQVWGKMTDDGHGGDLDYWRWDDVERVMIELEFYVVQEGE